VKVTIEQSQRTDPHEAYQNIFARLIRIPPTVTYHTLYFVNVHIEFTNEEKAIIHTYSPGEIVLEEEENINLINTAIDLYNNAKPITKDFWKREIDAARKTPLQTKLGDFTWGPIQRSFHTLREAADCAHRLKTKTLPQMKQTIEHYSSNGGNFSETFEL
jgi:hypothetical protein